MTDILDLEKQAKDSVSAGIASDPMAGTARTVPIMCQHISHASRLSNDPKPAIVAVCRGSMNAVLLGGQSVPDAAVALLEALPNMSLMMRAGPEDLMSWVMEGIADVTPMAGVEVRDALRVKIEEKFMGASTIFDEFCEAALKKKSS
ncbi:MAG: hypothetical protein COV48_00110 [Elusimicrobia bacterium CG11_big_fil_rev_8_21_14_0_20_64_6]|nr:MAG: hypothetical protein COV48_00110 [Elusimicrobia bacterium CG11_big_fil_rev_8_21_14_0_20_64_6]